jgi:2-keto-4-pentenoate hydratase/2-oxohepta-3-ene-1,7-dioic acid hydratase in catechol pathway
MRLVTFRRHSEREERLGALDRTSGHVVDLAAVQARRGRESAPALRSMQDLIEAGSPGLDLAEECLAAANTAEMLDRAAVTLLAPLPVPVQIRDCLCFEEHLLGALAAFERLGQPVPALTVSMLETFRRRPIWYKANRFAVVGPDVEVVWPRYSSVMDYECEMAAVIGVGGRDIPKARAASHIFGFTIFNDLSARDAQTEMAGGLGPAKSKDFDGANVFGPSIVTCDEFDPYDARMIVRVNGEKRSEGTSGAMKYRFEDLIAFISECETLHAGEILCSGTVGGGCGLEQGRFLEPGDVVELEIEGIGRLATRIMRE